MRYDRKAELDRRMADSYWLRFMVVLAVFATLSLGAWIVSTYIL